VMAGRIDRAFCAVRPPGHHAERDQAMGYCLFNHVAVAAEHLIQCHGLERVAIVDWDAHHGNGTQHIFEDREDVLFISLHESPRFLYPHSGYAHETGVGKGKGYTLNIPMAPGSDDATYRQAFEEKVMAKLETFAPQFILISAGFDGAREDRTTDINLEPASYAWLSECLAAIASRHGEDRIVSVLEGGYDLPSLGRCVTAHVQSMLEKFMDKR